MLVVCGAEIFQLPLDDILAFIGNFSLFFLERVLDLALGLRRHDDVQPVFRRPLLAGCDDLDLVAAAELMTDRYELMVDLCADALNTDRAVDRKSEVQRSGADGSIFTSPRGVYT